VFAIEQNEEKAYAWRLDAAQEEHLDECNDGADEV
jgi:hypothetical protein